MLDSSPWMCAAERVETDAAGAYGSASASASDRNGGPPVSASLEGGTAALVCPVDDGTSRRGTITSAEGVVRIVGDGVLELGGQLAHGAALPVTLRFTLPPEIDLRPLEGERVRITVREDALATRGRSKARRQTLTVQGSGANGATTWLVAHHGPGVALGAGPNGLTAALSSRSDGPLVFGTARLKCAVDPGDHVRVASADGEYVMYFLGRSPAGVATYVVGHARLWRGHAG